MSKKTRGPKLRGRAGKMIARHKRQVAKHQRSSDSNFIASADWFGNVYVWPVWSKTPTMTIETAHADRAQDAAFLTDHTRIVSCGFDGAIRVWDVASRDLLQEHQIFGARIWDVQVSHDERWILARVVTPQSSTHRIWPVSEGVIDFSSERSFDHPVGFVPAHTDTIWSRAKQATTISIRTLSSDAPITSIPARGVPTPAAFSRDGTKVVLQTNGARGLAVYDLTTGKVSRRVSQQHGQANWMHPCLADDGSLFAAFLGYGVLMWDVETGTQWMPEKANHTDVTTAMCFATDGTTLVTSGWDRTIRFWDLQGYIHQMQSS